PSRLRGLGLSHTVNAAVTARVTPASVKASQGRARSPLVTATTTVIQAQATQRKAATPDSRLTSSPAPPGFGVVAVLIFLSSPSCPSPSARPHLRHRRAEPPQGDEAETRVGQMQGLDLTARALPEDGVDGRAGPPI